MKMRALHFKNAAVNVVRDLGKNHTMAFAAALAYYFVLALFPFLIFLSAVVAHLHTFLARRGSTSDGATLAQSSPSAAPVLKFLESEE